MKTKITPKLRRSIVACMALLILTMMPWSINAQTLNITTPSDIVTDTDVDVCGAIVEYSVSARSAPASLLDFVNIKEQLSKL